MRTLEAIMYDAKKGHSLQGIEAKALALRIEELENGKELAEKVTCELDHSVVKTMLLLKQHDNGRECFGTEPNYSDCPVCGKTL